jgi:hypothetical protein
MSVMRSEGSVGHEWEADRRPRCGSVPVVVNTTSHLWRTSPDRVRDPLDWFPYDTPDLPCQALPCPTPGSMPRVSTGGGVLLGLAHLSLPRD